VNRFEEIHRRAVADALRRSTDRNLMSKRFDKPPPLMTVDLSRAIALEWVALQRYEGDWERDPGHAGKRAPEPFHLAKPPTDEEYEQEYQRLIGDA
jgi:hypothetical protein